MALAGRVSGPPPWHWAAVLIAVGLVACGPIRPVAYTLNLPPLVRVPASSVGIYDDRARFREIFCAVTEARGPNMPDARPCAEALTELPGEHPPTGRPVALGEARLPITLGLVNGLGGDCVAEFRDLLKLSRAHVAQFGYRSVTVPITGLGSTGYNGRIIGQFVDELAKKTDGPIVLLGHSKGVADILEALVTAPRLADQVAAVVSLSGAVGGSPLADETPEFLQDLFSAMPGAECSESDAGAIRSLRPAVRQQWLARHHLPQEVLYFSVVSQANWYRISGLLNDSYRHLSALDGRNDGQLMAYDQVVPGSHLLGYVNADHWAAAIPIGRLSPMLGRTLISENDFPREVLLEAILRHVEEVLIEAGRPLAPLTREPAYLGHR